MVEATKNENLSHPTFGFSPLKFSFLCCFRVCSILFGKDGTKRTEVSNILKCSRLDTKKELTLEMLARILHDKIEDVRYKKGYGLYEFGVLGTWNPNMKRYELDIRIYCSEKNMGAIRLEISGWDG